jgi:glyoxalase family protein
MTTFPYAGMGVRVGTKGAGQITLTSFSLPRSAIDFWRARLADRGVPFEEAPSSFGEDALLIHDPSGLNVRLVGTDADPRTPWTFDGIAAGHAIRGIHGITLLVRDPARTVKFITELLDGAITGEGGDATRIGINGGAPGQIVEVARAAGAPNAVNGLGTVHHVAFAVSDADAQLRMRRELILRGVQVTDVLDRQYFQSIYFREPNGVLFEIATLPPGFAVDEPMAQLGTALKLPPWEEPNRDAITAALPSVTY